MSLVKELKSSCIFVLAMFLFVPSAEADITFKNISQPTPNNPRGYIIKVQAETNIRVGDRKGRIGTYRIDPATLNPGESKTYPETILPASEREKYKWWHVKYKCVDTSGKETGWIETNIINGNTFEMSCDR
jgi:hypothetical protein